MSFRTELNIEGKMFPVRHFVVAVHRNTDSKGRPVSLPVWSISIVLDMTNDITITNWMIDPTKQVDGKLVVYKIDQDAKMKEVEFKKAYCYGLNDEFNSDASYGNCVLYIGGKDLIISSVALEQSWPGN